MTEETYFLYSTTSEPTDKPLLYKRLYAKKQENNEATNETFLSLIYKKLTKHLSN